MSSLSKDESGNFTFLSCGDKHILFWTLSGKNLTSSKVSISQFKPDASTEAAAAVAPAPGAGGGAEGGGGEGDKGKGKGKAKDAGKDGKAAPPKCVTQSFLCAVQVASPTPQVPVAECIMYYSNPMSLEIHSFVCCHSL